jgi:hypothetical protein
LPCRHRHPRVMGSVTDKSKKTARQVNGFIIGIIICPFLTLGSYLGWDTLLLEIKRVSSAPILALRSF